MSLFPTYRSVIRLHLQPSLQNRALPAMCRDPVPPAFPRWLGGASWAAERVRAMPGDMVSSFCPFSSLFLLPLKPFTWKPRVCYMS